MRLTIGFDNVWISEKNRLKGIYFSLSSWRNASVTAASLFGISDDGIHDLCGNNLISEIAVCRRRAEIARMDYDRAIEEFKIPSYYAGLQRINGYNLRNHDDLSVYDELSYLGRYGSNNNNNQYNEKNCYIYGRSEVSNYFSKHFGFTQSSLPDFNRLCSQSDTMFSICLYC